MHLKAAVLLMQLGQLAAGEKIPVKKKILQRFLEESAPSDAGGYVIKAGKGSEPLKISNPDNKTIIIAEVPRGLANGGAGFSKEKAKTKKHKKSSAAPPPATGDAKGKQDDVLSPNHSIQPELTFEAPTSASFLLKPLDIKKMVLSEADVKRVQDMLAEFKELTGRLSELQKNAEGWFNMYQHPETGSKEKKTPTDLLNYNFIEVTEPSKK
jgi:hypothetical protein